MNKEEYQKLPPQAILKMPHLNRGTAFTQQERDQLQLNGRLPSHVSSMEEQLQRRYSNFKGKESDLAKVNFLSNVQKRNEVLFYRFCLEHCEEVLPYLYTPYVGDVSLNYSNLYAQNRGLFLNYDQKDIIEEIIQNYPYEVSVIVVTDGSRILGLGDVGIGGMSIPNGKLTLYSLFGGIKPIETLPIMLDVGTNNEELLKDPLYIGLHQKRVQGQDYYDFIDRFVKAVKKRWPKVLLQWEDFQKPYAQNLLKTYQDQICSFNDDIQGTAAVTLSALLAALKHLKQDLKNQKFCIVGAGGAGIGIANLIVEKLVKEGVHEEEARKQFFLFDREGLIHEGLQDLDEHQKKYAHPKELFKDWKLKETDRVSLHEGVQNIKPTALIGVCGIKGAFTKEVIESMASGCDRPIIFPLSNPTDHAEATPKDLYEWTKGQCIVATGSPFDPVEYNGKTFEIGQCNNVYIFPGVGLGVIAARPTKVLEDMFITAAEVLSQEAPLLKDPTKSIFPHINDLREISKKIALKVAEEAKDNGLMQQESSGSLEELIDQCIWYPEYTPIFK